jgi:hypothetical protein
MQDCPGKQNWLLLSSISQPNRVMPGLVPGIHAERTVLSSEALRDGAAWMAGTSPAMTSVGLNR